LVAGWRVEECIQVLDDTELYRVSAAGRQGALKIARPGVVPGFLAFLQREARILERLNGRVAPPLLARGATDDGQAYLVTQWISGQLCSEAASGWRAASRELLPQPLLAMCGRIIDAYAVLQELGVMHSDVHQRNLLIEESGEIRIIDYGLSRVEDDTELADAPRGGVGFFLDPECATSMLAGQMPPLSTRSGDQYSVAALIYNLLTGQSYLNFAYEKEVVLQQIVEQPPVPLAERGIIGWTALDRVLERALSKQPTARFPDMRAMAASFRQAASGSGSTSQIAKRTKARAAGFLTDPTHASRWLDSFVRATSDATMVFAACEDTCPPSSPALEAGDVAYALFRIACTREDAKLGALAARWLDRAIRETAVDGATPKHDRSVAANQGIVRLACLQALQAHSVSDFSTLNAAVQIVVQLLRQPPENMDMTNGKSGWLVTVSGLVDALGWDQGSQRERLVQAGNALLTLLWQQIDELPTIDKSSAGTCLGIADGWAGYLYATLRWMQSAHTSAPASLVARLEELAEQSCWRECRAGWPSQPQPESLEYGGWSSGSAGFVFLWSLAHRLLRNSCWLSLAEAAGWDACQPREEGWDLCCGLTGKAYSQLHLYKHTSDRVWLDNAFVMATLAVQQAQMADSGGRVLPSFGLYRGMAGLAVLISDLERPEFSAMPCFEEEGWPIAADR
jgi:serine/threonine-protein kinase